jgi:hypothetical protein
MSIWNRRGFLRTLAALPVFGFSSGAFSQATTTNGNEDEHLFLGVQLMRLLNTAQAWHRNEHGTFASKSELRHSHALSMLHDSHQAETRGIGRTLLDRFQWTGEEVVPGWLLRLETSDPPKGYLLLARSTLSKSVAFVTDERGVIYDARSIAENPRFPAADPLKEVVQHSGITGNGRIRRALSTVFGSFLFQYCATYCTWECTCCWSCQGSVPPGCEHGTYFNCGCQPCVWCVCPYCNLDRCLGGE